MKKLICTLLAAAMLAGCSGSSTAATSTNTAETAAAAALKDGTYSGTATGFHGDVSVAVTIADGKISNVEVTDGKETDYIADNAIKQLPQDIVEKQSVAVDSYSGCTVSSMAVKRAAQQAIEQAGDASAFEKAPEQKTSTETEDVNTDVVVIGGGMGGLASALTARDNGADVILIEKLDRLGGSTVESGGYLYATGTYVNKDVDDDPKALADYWQERAEGHADMNMLMLGAENSASTVDQLTDWGVIFAKEPVAAGTSPALRGLFASDSEADGAATSGIDFIKPLDAKAKETGVDIRLGTTAKSLIIEDGTVKGVTAVDKTGKTYNIHAGSVIIATGGYDQNQKMMSEYNPDMKNEFSLASIGNTGDGITMAEAAGAATDFPDGIIGFRMIDISTHYFEGANLLGWLGLLSVTNEGKRYGNELADYPVYHRNMIDAMDAGAESFWIVMDSSLTDYTPLAELAVSKNLGYKADSIADLASQAGIDADVLQSTIDEYNGLKGSVDSYGKTVTDSVTTGPFYAIKLQPATLGTIGGLVINENAEVLDKNNHAIPNLYACGEVANSKFFYQVYPASGSSISTTATMGIIAGNQASANASAAD